jgi:thiamine biosynthesis lipoprotein
MSVAERASAYSSPSAERCAPGATRVRARPLLGTLVEIAAAGSRAGVAIERAFAAVEEVHRLMSYHDVKSDVSRINREGPSREVEVSRHTWRVLEAARAFAEQSGGLFDITIAPALAALGFLPRHRDFPRATTGDWRNIELREPNRVRLTRRVRIDLGGIAKGYAVDRAVEVLRSLGVQAGRVNAGGDLRIYGSAPQTVRVRCPDAPTSLGPRLSVRDGAAATSADYFSARYRRGRRVTPIVHPGARTACARGRSVTVLAADCLTADALTKVVHADPERAVTALMTHSARALMLESSHGEWRAHAFDPALGAGWLGPETACG